MASAQKREDGSRMTSCNYSFGPAYQTMAYAHTHFLSSFVAVTGWPRRGAARQAVGTGQDAENVPCMITSSPPSDPRETILIRPRHLPTRARDGPSAVSGCPPSTHPFRAQHGFSRVPVSLPRPPLSTAGSFRFCFEGTSRSYPDRSFAIGYPS